MKINVPDVVTDELVDAINRDLARPFGDVPLDVRAIVFTLHQQDAIEVFHPSYPEEAMTDPMYRPKGQYRIRAKAVPSVPDSIDWSHVAPRWKFMARDEYGPVYLYEREPSAYDTQWVAEGAMIRTAHFSSFVRGTVDWKDSLVERPE